MKTRVFEAYIYAGRVLGNERAHLPPSQSVRGFQHTYDFRGKSAHIVVVSNDPNLSRDTALEFATAIANERFARFTVDLAVCYLKRDDKNNRLWTGENLNDARQC